MSFFLHSQHQPPPNAATSRGAARALRLGVLNAAQRPTSQVPRAGASADTLPPSTMGRGEQLHLQHHRDLAQSKHKENPALDMDPPALAAPSPKH